MMREPRKICKPARRLRFSFFVCGGLASRIRSQAATFLFF